MNRMYPPNAFDSEAQFMDLYVSITNGFVPSKINDKCANFELNIVNFPCLDGDVPLLPHTGFTFLNLFDRVTNHVTNVSAYGKILTAKFLQRGFRYHKFSKHYR